MRNYLTYLVVVLLGFSCGQKPLGQLHIEVSQHDRYQVPISVHLGEIAGPGSTVHLEDPKSGEVFAAEVDSEGMLFAVIPQLPIGNHQFNLMQGKVAAKQVISIHTTNEGIEVKNGEKPVFFYQTAMAFPPEGLPDYYKRNGMIHPLFSPGGQVITDDFPAGHVHQHAIFNAWVNTLFKGEKVDFWNQHQGTGTVEHKEVVAVDEGALKGSFTVKQSHISHLHGEVLEETWQLVSYPTDGFYVFDLYSEQVNTSQDTLHIVEYHYGGMGFRGSKEWNTVDTVHYSNEWNILTSEGHDKETANHTKAKWVSAYGDVAGETVGVTVFGHPDNFRYPQIVRVHPTMPYWVYSPMFEGAFYIAPGQRFKSKFRFYVHQGAADTRILAGIQADMTHPITVKVTN